jgi:hypothetical protein
MAYIGQAPTAVPLVAGDFADGSISEAKLGPDAVSLAKMKAGTDGNIISYDASGNPVAIATGSDGQVLTSAGAGAPPLFEALPAGGYTELGVAATSSGAASTISGIPAGVKTVLIIWNKISMTGAAEVNMQLGDSGGLETSGYLSNNHKHTTASGHYAQFNDTAHFGISQGGGGADPFSTVMHLTRSASGVNDWVVTWIAYQSTEPAQTMGVGMKTLSGELTQIAVITNGTFDGGGWNAYYQ